MVAEPVEDAGPHQDAGGSEGDRLYRHPLGPVFLGKPCRHQAQDRRLLPAHDRSEDGEQRQEGIG